jgi:hypothetical protein
MSRLIFIAALCVLTIGISAQDTLHLHYHPMHLAPHDSVQARIDSWIKTLDGKKQDLTVYAYYEKDEFKKYSVQRADELFIVLNRKARDLFDIKFIGPKKGDKTQRALVDIIYKPAGFVPEKKGKKKADKKADEKPAPNPANEPEKKN